MPSEELLEKVSHLPTTPGVYLWRDQYNRIIYVGKAEKTIALLNWS